MGKLYFNILIIIDSVFDRIGSNGHSPFINNLGAVDLNCLISDDAGTSNAVMAELVDAIIKDDNFVVDIPKAIQLLEQYRNTFEAGSDITIVNQALGKLIRMRDSDGGDSL